MVVVVVVLLFIETRFCSVSLAGLEATVALTTLRTLLASGVLWAQLYIVFTLSRVSMIYNLKLVILLSLMPGARIICVSTP